MPALTLDGIPGRGIPGLFIPGAPVISEPAPAGNLTGARVTIAPGGASPLVTPVQGTISPVSAVIPWTLTLPAGTFTEYTFTFDILNAATGFFVPFPITGMTWEYVVRATPTSGGSPLIDVTTTSGTDGQITVTATLSLSQILLSLLPTATASLSPGSYAHALWGNPSTAAAFCWMSGTLLIAGTPAP